MAVFHYERQRSPGERDVDAAVARAETQCAALQARVDRLEEHIVETRRLAATAGIFDPRITLVSEPRRLRRLRRPAPAAVAQPAAASPR